MVSHGTTKKGQSLWKDAWRRLKRNRFAMIGLVIVTLMTLAALLADILMPYAADYGQPWARSHPPGYCHPAVMGETRLDAGVAPTIPADIPDAVADVLGADGGDATLEFRVHERESVEFLIRVRKGKVERIQQKEGALSVPRLEVAGDAEYLEVTGEGGGAGTHLQDLVIETRRDLPPALRGADESGTRMLVLARIRPRTPQPETIQVRLASGTVASITRDGVAVESLRLDARHVMQVKKNGAVRFLRHWLGTDEQGRDELTRVLYGGRISLMVGGVATLVSVLIGVIYGALAGYLASRPMGAVGVGAVLLALLAASMLLFHVSWGMICLVLSPILVFGVLTRVRAFSWLHRPVTTTGEFMMRIVDIFYALPFMFLVILLMVAFGRDIIILFICLGAVEWLTMSRIVRGQVLSLKEKEFIEAARMCGASHFSIVFRHLIPNTLGVVVVYATLTIPAVILQESFLAFIGLNVEFKGRALDSWGALVNQGRQALTADGDRWWILLFPSLAMTLTLLSLNFLGDGLRDALDPKMKGRT